MLDYGNFEIILDNDVSSGYVVADAIKLLSSCSAIPSVQIAYPKNYHLQTSSDLNVVANLCLDGDIHSNWGVKFVLDEGTEVYDHEAPFEFPLTGLSSSEHKIEAFVVDSSDNEISGINTYNKIFNIGIGDYYVAIGDSITEGYGDIYWQDNISSDGRDVGGGFEPILNNLLTTARSIPHHIANEGVGGTKSIYWGK